MKFSQAAVAGTRPEWTRHWGFAFSLFEPADVGQDSSAPVVIDLGAVNRGVFLRSPDGTYLRDRLQRALQACAEGAALATGAEVEISHSSPAYLLSIPTPCS